MNKKTKAALLTYLYAAVSTVAALWTSGQRDLRTLALAAISAVLAPLASAVNPKDTTLGIGSSRSASKN